MHVPDRLRFGRQIIHGCYARTQGETEAGWSKAYGECETGRRDQDEHQEEEQLTKERPVPYRPPMPRRPARLCASIFGAVLFVLHPSTSHSQEIIPRGSVLTTVTGTATTVHEMKEWTAPGYDGVFTRTRFSHEGWGERADPWMDAVGFQISHGYRAAGSQVELGLLLHGESALQGHGGLLHWDMGSFGTADFWYRSVPEFVVDVALPAPGGMSLLLGGYRRTMSSVSLPAFDTPFVVRGMPSIVGVYGGVGVSYQGLAAQATVGTAEGTLDAILEPSAVEIMGTAGLDAVYTGSIEYGGRRSSFRVQGSFGRVGVDAYVSSDDRSLGVAVPESGTAGYHYSWSAGAALGKSAGIGWYGQRLSVGEMEGYLDLRNLSPGLNGLIPNRFNYTIVDIHVDGREFGILSWYERRSTRWSFGVGGAISRYSAAVRYEAFYRRFGVFREDTQGELLDIDGHLLTISGQVAILLLPGVDVSVSSIGVIPLDLDYFSEADLPRAIAEGADAADTWRGSRLQFELRIAVPHRR